MNPEITYKIDISMHTLLKVLAVIAVIGFLFLIKSVVAIVFVALLLILLLQPAVHWISGKGVPKGVAVLLMYILSLGVLVLAISLIIPPVLKEAEAAVAVLGEYIRIVAGFFGVTISPEFNDLSQTFGRIKEYLPDATQNIFSQLSSFVQAFVTLAVVLVMTFYGLVEESAFKEMVRSFVPSKFQPYLYFLGARVQKQLGLWLRAQLLLALFIFVLTFIGLTVLGVEYALVLAILAGVLEFIPYVGPLLCGVIAIFLTLFTSPIKALLVLILFIIIQQLENHVLVPKIMQKATGLNPVISIIAILTGAQLGGVIGVLLAIPVTLVLSVFVEDVVSKNIENQSKLES